MDVYDSLWAELNQLFSVVCQLNPDGRIVRASRLLRERCDLDVSNSQNFFETFKFKRPVLIDGSYQSAQAAVGQLFLGFSESHQFAIRGQMIELSKYGVEGLCFVGVPWLWWMQSNATHAPLALADFPVHDVQMDQLFFMSAQQAMVEDLQMSNDALAAAKETVEKSIQIKQNFFHHVSHEMRTPLNGVISAIALVPKNNLPSKTLELLDVATRSGEQLLEVINFTLESASAADGLANEPSELFDTHILCADVLGIIRTQALDSGVDLAFTIDKSKTACYRGQARLLKKVLINLLANAVKFTERGSVGLTVEISTDARAGCDRLDIVVEDTGIGIPKSELLHIFEPFVHSVTPGVKSTNGTGLGLSLVKHYVDAMGGELVVTSVIGKGSRFQFSVVFERADPCELAEMQMTSLLFPDNKLHGNILLVDDSETNLLLNAEILRALGLTVETANSGEAAVAQVTSNPNAYQLVLMDLDMPDVDGFEATRRIRLDSACNAPPIFAFTAFMEGRAREKSTAAGISGFIRKPVSPKELFRHLAPLLSVGMQFVDESQEVITVDPLVENFDTRVFTTLAHEIGVDVTGTLVNKFLIESAGRWENLHNAVAAADTPFIAREAHTLGSACLSLGLMSAGMAFRHIEAEVRGGRPLVIDKVDNIAADLNLGLQRLEQTLNELRGA